MIGANVIRVGTSRNEDHGEVLGICSTQSVECRESPDTKCHHACRCSVGASITFRRKGAVELVAGIYLLQVFIEKKLIQQGEVVIAGHGKVVLESDLHQSGCQVA